MAVVYWLFMMVGFSDNWLTEVQQKSNSEVKYIFHGLIAFFWFSLLVVQSGLIRKGKVHIHKKLGLVALPLFYILIITVGYIAFTQYEEKGALNAITTMVSLQAIIATIVISIGFYKRRIDSQQHKLMMTFGSFCLTQAAINRTVYWLFGTEYVFIFSLIILLVMLMAFIWYSKSFKWFYGAWIVSFIVGILLVI